MLRSALIRYLVNVDELKGNLASVGDEVKKLWTSLDTDLKLGIGDIPSVYNKCSFTFTFCVRLLCISTRTLQKIICIILINVDQTGAS